MEINQISILGTGRVGSNLAFFLKKIAKVYVWNRTPEKSFALESKGCKAFTEIEKMPKSDLYLISVSDATIPIVAQKLFPYTTGNSIVAHTSGTTSLDGLKIFDNQRAVLYPLQTFYYFQIDSLENIPFLFESKTEEIQQKLEKLSSDIGGRPQYAGSQEREQIHLSAVIACNLTMELWNISQEHLTSKGLDPEILNPLISQTVENMMTFGPDAALTGPAVRGDMTTLLKHLKTLDDESVKAVFCLLNERIYSRKN